MRRTVYALVTLVTLPFLAGCYGVMRTSVPASQPERQALELRGVVVNGTGGNDDEVLEFTELHQATWTRSALSCVADVNRGGGRSETVTRLVPLTEIDAVLVRQLDAGRTSAIVGGLIVGVIAAVTIIITGDADSYQPG